MKKLSLALAAFTVFAMLSLMAPSAQAHRRVIVAGPAYRTAYFSPVVPVYRPRVFVRAAYPVVVPVAPNYLAAPVVVIPPGPFGGYGYTTLSTGTTTYFGW
jgi:hypothetical protein